MTPVDRARHAIAALLMAFEDADTNGREAISGLIALHLTPSAGRTLTEMAQGALADASRGPA